MALTFLGVTAHTARANGGFRFSAGYYYGPSYAYPGYCAPTYGYSYYAPSHRVYYAPAPRVYYTPPVYSLPPVYYAPPVYFQPPVVTFGFNFGHGYRHYRHGRW